jgi:hypothetical protein
MARAPVSKTGGWGFESLHSCHGPSWSGVRPGDVGDERTYDMGDNLVPNGLSMVCKVLCSRSI